MALDDNHDQEEIGDQNELENRDEFELQSERKVRFLRAALYFSFGAFVLLWMMLFLQGCAPKNEDGVTKNGGRVVLYCSVDEVYAKPLIKKLETQTGLQIDALFDTEATKTAGLANRIRAEQSRPRADVFWSSALLQTLLMSEEGLLEPYESPSAKDLPSQFVGKDWAGVGTRVRVFTISEPRFSYVNRLWIYEDFSPGSSVGFSNPQFGTASDWVTSLALRQGQKQLLRRFRNMKAQENRVLPGNGDVARQVGRGILTAGVTDSDDFLAQKREGNKIFLAKPSSDIALIPGAVSILKGAPNAANARKLFDAIASTEGERALTQQMPGVFSLRRLNEKSNFQSGGQDFSFLMNAPRDDYSKWPAAWREIRGPLNQIFTSK